MKMKNSSLIGPCLKCYALCSCVTYGWIQQKNHWLSGVRVDCCKSFIYWILFLKMHFYKAPVSFTAITTAEVCLKPKPL